MIRRFFNEVECSSDGSDQRLSEHYAVRFAAKEAFSKALGTGIKGFDLTDIYIRKNSEGQPTLIVTGSALRCMEARFGKSCVVHISLSHEKEYALAFAIIEQGE